MSEATWNLVSREALELHFEGATYGPIEHTQALGVLLFALRPSKVRCATPAGAFQAAMRKVLAAAEGTARVLQACADDAGSDDLPGHVDRAHLAVWLDAGCRAAPAQRVEALRATLNDRLGANPWRQPLH